MPEQILYPLAPLKQFFLSIFLFFPHTLTVAVRGTAVRTQPLRAAADSE